MASASSSSTYHPRYPACGVLQPQALVGFDSTATAVPPDRIRRDMEGLAAGNCQDGCLPSEWSISAVHAHMNKPDEARTGGISCWQARPRRRPRCRAQGTGIGLLVPQRPQHCRRDVAVEPIPLWNSFSDALLGGQAHDRPRDRHSHRCPHADRAAVAQLPQNSWAEICHSRRYEGWPAARFLARLAPPGCLVSGRGRSTHKAFR